MIMRISNAWNREIESEKERKCMRKERLRIQLWKNPITSMHEALSNLYSSTVHHAVPRLRIITRLRLLMYKRVHIIMSITLHTHLQNEQGKMCDERWWGGGGARRRGVLRKSIHGYRAVMNSSWGEFWYVVGWSVGHLSTRTRFSANEGTVRYKSTLERTRDE